MNGKRQTIWLVSMLSLMVVLSAYYLFTEDSGVSAPTETAGTIQVEGKVKDAGGSTLPSVGDEGVVINEVVKDGEVVTDPGTAADSGAVATDTTTTTTTTTATNSSKDGVATDTIVKDPLASEQAAATSETTKDPVKDTAVKDKEASASADQPVVKDDAAILDEVASQSVSASSMFTNYQ